MISDGGTWTPTWDDGTWRVLDFLSILVLCYNPQSILGRGIRSSWLLCKYDTCFLSISLMPMSKWLCRGPLKKCFLWNQITVWNDTSRGVVLQSPTLPKCKSMVEQWGCIQPNSTQIKLIEINVPVSYDP